MTRIFRVAVEATNVLQNTVEIDHIPATCHFMQIVNILRDDAGHMTAALQFGNCAMRRVGFCARYSVPSCKALRPVLAPLALVIDEFCELHRLSMFPVAIVVPILGNARVRAATGARQSQYDARTQVGHRHVDDAGALTEFLAETPEYSRIDIHVIRKSGDCVICVPPPPYIFDSCFVYRHAPSANHRSYAIDGRTWSAWPDGR